MSSRSAELAATFAATNQYAVDMITNMTEAELNAECEDSTVAAVALHFAAGHNALVRWVRAVLAGETTVPGRGDRSAAPHRASKMAILSALERGAPAMLATLAALTDEQLDLITPPGPHSDGTQTIAEVLAFVDHHRHEHLDNLRAAVARAAAVE